MIACVLFPTFTASLALRDGNLDHKKTVLVYDSLTGEVVATSAKATDALGTRIVAAAHARPGSHLVPYHPGRVDEAFDETLHLLRDFSDRIEPHRDTNVVYVHTDIGRLTPSSGLRLGRKIRRRMRRALGLPATVGLARGKFTAHLAACHTDDVRLIAPARELAEIGVYPVGLLPLEREALRRLDLFGITTIGGFARLPRPAVIAQFGREAITAHDLARGVDRRPVEPMIPQRTVSAAYDFDDATTDRERLIACVYCETARAFEHVQREGFVAVTLTITLQQHDDGETVIARQPTQPVETVVQLERQIRDALRDLTGTVEGFRVTMRCEQPPAPTQLTLFPDDDALAYDLRLLADKMRARYGQDTVFNARRINPDAPIPERRIERVS